MLKKAVLARGTVVSCYRNWYCIYQH